MIANGGWVDFQIPSCVAPGQYLLRTEIIALHSASKQGGAQFYIVSFPRNFRLALLVCNAKECGRVVLKSMSVAQARTRVARPLASQVHTRPTTPGSLSAFTTTRASLWAMANLTRSLGLLSLLASPIGMRVRRTTLRLFASTP